MTDTDLVLRQDAQGVAHLTLNNPAKLNALSTPLLKALDQSLSEISQDRDVHAVIISGAGKAFSPGHDLGETTVARKDSDGGKAAYVTLFNHLTGVLRLIRTMPQPVIAQVHGIATAAGCQLVASCDMALAAEGTRFGVNGVNIGLFCSTPMVALTRNLPRKHAFELLTAGGFISADRAAELGLINRVVPAADLEAETRALAETVAAKLPAAIRIGKSTFYDQLELPVDKAYELTAAAMVENMLDPDTAEGIDAFLEKRPPNW
ncbi:MAG: enoyl-CoA hydratase [Mangrovicoccus sp.]|nr:enoyl-CoA hydratase [Mangrovicoccus sp.]